MSSARQRLAEWRQLAPEQRRGAGRTRNYTRNAHPQRRKPHYHKCGGTAGITVTGAKTPKYQRPLTSIRGFRTRHPGDGRNSRVCLPLMNRCPTNHFPTPVRKGKVRRMVKLRYLPAFLCTSPKTPMRYPGSHFRSLDTVNCVNLVRKMPLNMNRVAWRNTAVFLTGQSLLRWRLERRYQRFRAIAFGIALAGLSNGNVRNYRNRWQGTGRRSAGRWAAADGISRL